MGLISGWLWYNNNYDLAQPTQMLVVPDYLAGATFNGTYFVTVPGDPDTALTVDSRKQPVVDLAFGASTNRTITGYGYTTYRVQVPVQQIAWQINVTPSAGEANVAVRRDKVPNEWNNDAFSEVAGNVTDSITLVPPTLSDGTYYITVYGSAYHHFTLANLNPDITDITFTSSTPNDAPNRAGWRFYRLPDIDGQLGHLGWNLTLQGQVPGTEIALRRNAVPGRWNYRNNGIGYYNNSPAFNTTTGNMDYSGTGGFLQRPGHQADIWYVGVYQPSAALGNFTLNSGPIVPTPGVFDGPGASVGVVDQPAGKWNYWRIDVPAGALGWDLRLVGVTDGSPALVVRRDLLPDGVSTHGANGLYWYYPHGSVTWPSGNQWAAGGDWTGDSYTPDGVDAHVQTLAMGMGRPLEAGTYYVGVYATGDSSYTLQSRGIGAGFAIPVMDLPVAGEAVTNTVAAREAVYYRLEIPTNTPSWRLRLTPTVGEALLLVNREALPNVGAESGYPYYSYGGLSGAGHKMQKAGKEQYVLLPDVRYNNLTSQNETNLPPGTYYVAVVGEGQNPVPSQARIGTNSTTYVLQTLGALPVVEMGALNPVGGADLQLTNQLAGGSLAAYHFTVPTNTLVVEARLEGRVGEPWLGVGVGTNLFGFNYSYYYPYHDPYGNDGGVSGASYDASLLTFANPAAGDWSVMVMARNQNGTYPDASYTLRLRAREPDVVLFDNGITNVVGQADRTWRYYKIEVPASALGWDLRLLDVTIGSPALVVRRDLLPDGVSTHAANGSYWYYPYSSMTWPSGNQWAAGGDWTGHYQTEDGQDAKVNMLAMGMGNPLEPGTYYVGVYANGESSYTLQSRGIGAGLAIAVVDLPFAGGSLTNTLVPREAAYYRVQVPSNAPSWRVRLTPTTGEASLLERKAALPNVGSDGYYNTGGGKKMQKAGNEQYLLLPSVYYDSVLSQSFTNLGGGTYFLGVVSEGQNPDSSRIGSNTTTYVLETLPALPMTDLGTLQPVGGSDLTVAGALQGGSVAAYQFTVPTNTLVLEVRLEDRVGNPWMGFTVGTDLPSPNSYPVYSYYQNYSDFTYGAEGGVGANWNDGSLITVPNPALGAYSLTVMASYPWPDASYTLRLRAREPDVVPFNNGGTNVVGQADRTWRYYKIEVPTNALGWDLRLVTVTNGTPQMYVRSGLLPDAGTYTWSGQQDWTGDSLTPDGNDGHVQTLIVSPAPGSYYVGVYASGECSYTIQSRGIGTGLAIPVVDLPLTGGNVTNTLVPREVAYYRVQVPSNAPSWRVRLTPTAGEALLLERVGDFPSFYGAPHYGGLQQLGKLMQKAGNEHYLLLPSATYDSALGRYVASLASGTYYLGVVSEGQNPNGGRIGSNTTTYVLETLPALPVTDLGALHPVGNPDVTVAGALQGGSVAAYQFTVPPNTLVMEVRLEDRVGNPWMGFTAGTDLPSPNSYPVYSYYQNYQDFSYGAEGGVGATWNEGSLVTVANPVAGVYSLTVKASHPWPDASYTLRLRQLAPPPLNFSADLNTNGLSNVATANLADNQRAFFRVTIPATNAGLQVIGWNLRLTQSQGTPTSRVRRGGIPFDGGPDTTGWFSGTVALTPPYLSPGEYIVEVRGGNSTTFTLTSTPILLQRPAWTMPALGATTTVTPGLVFPTFADTGTDTNGVALPPEIGELPPGDRGVDLARGDFHYYAIIVPTNNAGLLSAKLEAISGNPNLYLRAGAVPSLAFSYYYDRTLAAGTQTEYGNWVPVDGRSETRLTPGIWYLAVEAAGDSNVRYRLRLSVGNVLNLTLNGGSYANQVLAGGDWRYYRVQIPVNAPTNWTVTFSQQVGDVVMYVRDDVPPGMGSPWDYYTLLILDWTTDNKNQGPYANYDAPGSYTFGTPPLRPGHTYYLGFRAVNDATFTVSSSATGALPNFPALDFYTGTSTTNIPPGGELTWRIYAPAEATQWRHTSTHSADVQVAIEQGTLSTPSGSAHWRSYAGYVDTTATYDLTGWPWLPAQFYYLTARNTSGTSQPFSLNLSGGIRPRFGSLLADQTVMRGSDVTFAAAAAVGGSPDITYQWYWNNSYLYSATNTTLILTNVQLSQAGTYFLRAQNSYGYADLTAMLTVNSAPYFTGQPVGGTSGVGLSYSFNTAVEGTAPVALQWLRSGTPLANATNLSLTLTNLTSGNAGDYVLRATNVFGVTNSITATLAVIAPVIITNPPLPQLVLQGATAQFSVGASGGGPLQYQWRFNGSDLYGATNSTLGLTNVQMNQAGLYSVAVANAANSAAADTVLRVVAFAPDNGHFYEVVPFATNWPGAKLAAEALHFNSATGHLATITNQVENDFIMNLLSAHSWLGGYQPPGSAEPADGFRWVTAEPFSFTNWYSGQPDDAGGGSSQSYVQIYTFGTWDDAYDYETKPFVVEYDPAGMPPLIMTQPVGQDVAAQSAVDLSVLAGGEPVLSYRWRLGASSIPNATNATYSIVAATTNDAGLYSVVVSNRLGSVTSSIVALTVTRLAQAITFAPLPNRRLDQLSFLLTATADSGLPVSYSSSVPTVATVSGSNVTLRGVGTTIITATQAGSSSYLPISVSQTLTVDAVPATMTALARSLNATNFAWFTTDGAEWFAQTTVTHDGIEAAQSGPIGNNGQTWLEIEVTGPAEVSFWWKVSSEDGFDFLQFFVDGIEIPGGISGEVDWQKRSAIVPAGLHTLRWAYTKDSSSSVGADAAWVDEVRLMSLTGPPVIYEQPLNVVTLANSNVVFSVVANGEPNLSYQWRHGLSGILNATNASYSITSARASDAGSYSVVISNRLGTVTSSNAVLIVNTAPVLSVITQKTVNELSTLTVANTATDVDLPVNTLNYTLLVSPVGLAINSSGVITWTPTEAQGPSTNTVTTKVSDNGVPSLSATNTFLVVVNEVNTAPVLPVIAQQTINELTTLLVANTATDADLPANILTYSLLASPAGMTINSASGVITWTPTEAQGPSTNTVTVRVSDNGVPSLSATNTFLVVVNEVNTAPVLPVIAQQTVNELTTLSVTNTATDADLPANTLTYSLLVSPSGMTINTASGVITWTPTEAQGPSTNTVTTKVSDNGTPSLSATNTFTVVVNEVNTAPVLPVIAQQTVNELTTLTVTNLATDADLPANTLTYSLLVLPPGMTINSASGVITWTPTEGQGPSTNTVTTKVTDNGTPSLSATNTFLVVVNEVNVAPVLPVIPQQTVSELSTLTVTNTASDADLPANTLTYSLLVSPPGMTINSASGVITWTPTEALGPSTNTVTTKVSDNGTPSLSATNTFTVVVNEVNVAPVLPVQTNRTVNELTTLLVTNTATDADLPANTLTYSLIVSPAGMTINTASGVITWTPTEAQGPSTNTVTTKVSDNGVPSLSATNTFLVVVNEVNVEPVLPVQTNRTINELVTLTVTNTAADADLPSNILTYSLLASPAGMTINSASGVISWTPTEGQGPSTNNVTTKVSDNGVPSLSATNSFLVVVTEANTAPVLTTSTNRTVNPGETVTFTNTATDADTPANTLTFSLLSGPVGATVNPGTGQFTWRPSITNANTTNTIQVRVTDNGSPALSDTRSFTITVQSLTPVTLTPLGFSGSNFRVNISGPVGPDYTLQTRGSLTPGQPWVSLTTTNPLATPFQLDVIGARTIPTNRFFRILLGP